MNMIRRNVAGLYTAILILLLTGVAGLTHNAAHAQHAVSSPWTSKEVTQPGQLAAMLASHSAKKPVILQVGFAVLYRSKHIPGAIFSGPASTPQGLQALKQVAARLPKNAEIYVYCGCCPIDKCPNIRPAFEALQSMGFTHLHVVMLQTSFGQDWVAHGYPVAGESAPGR